jgi:hypothetical protein
MIVSKSNSQQTISFDTWLLKPSLLALHVVVLNVHKLLKLLLTIQLDLIHTRIDLSLCSGYGRYILHSL